MSKFPLILYIRVFNKNYYWKLNSNGDDDFDWIVVIV